MTSDQTADAIDAILRITTEFFHVTVEQLISRERTSHIVHARQMAMYAMRRLTPMSYPQIGEQFGGRDHSTVMHAHNSIHRKSTNGRAVEVGRYMQLCGHAVEPFTDRARYELQICLLALMVDPVIEQGLRALTVAA